MNVNILLYRYIPVFGGILIMHVLGFPLKDWARLCTVPSGSQWGCAVAKLIATYFDKST